MAVGGMAAVGLVAGAAGADDKGWFGEVTAAWIQAVGSVAAIMAAIVIDQGSARRHAAQLDRADAAERRTRAELAVAVLVLATQGVNFTAQARERVNDPKWPLGELYARWRGVAEHTADSLNMIAMRLVDPNLLTETLSMVRTIRPPAKVVMVTEVERVLEEKWALLDPVMARLITAVDAIFRDSDLDLSAMLAAVTDDQVDGS
jgi:hypothetical protein